jgi:hypothetical protein
VVVGRERVLHANGETALNPGPFDGAALHQLHDKADEADRFDLEQRWLAAQAPVSIRDQI